MNELTAIQKLPNGLTPLLSKSLDSQTLAKHRAVVAFELEVLAKKVDRFGWERDRGTPAHDRLLIDWMNALQDYPIEEVQAACAAAVLDKPDKLPNEGHVKAQIIKARREFLAKQPKPLEAVVRHTPTATERANAEKMLADAGYAVKRMDGAA